MGRAPDGTRYGLLQHLVEPGDESWRVILAYIVVIAVLAFVGGTAMGYAYGYQDGEKVRTEVPSGTEREEGP